MQLPLHPDLKQRLLYYWAGNDRDQLQQGQEYSLIRRTFTICILNGVLFRKEPGYHTRYQMLEVTSHRRFSEDFQLDLIELPKYHEAVENITDPLGGWVWFLQHATDLDSDQLPKALARPPIQKAVRELIRMQQTQHERELYEAR
jgi:predicted transposase/invertase (TIGR01784 family)